MNLSKTIGRITRALLVASAGLASIGVGGAAEGSSVTWPTRAWQVGTPASVGLDEETLDILDSDLAAGKYSLVDSFQVFRCGEEVFSRRYPHDYSTIYAKEAATKGPLNARLTGRYNYFDPLWHPYYHAGRLQGRSGNSGTDLFQHRQSHERRRPQTPYYAEGRVDDDDRPRLGRRRSL